MIRCLQMMLLWLALHAFAGAMPSGSCCADAPLAVALSGGSGTVPAGPDHAVTGCDSARSVSCDYCTASPNCAAVAAATQHGLAIPAPMVPYASPLEQPVGFVTGAPDRPPRSPALQGQLALRTFVRAAATRRSICSTDSDRVLEDKEILMIHEPGHGRPAMPKLPPGDEMNLYGIARRSLLGASGSALIALALPGTAAAARSPSSVVALAFDGTRQSLFKATAGAVYRSNDGGRRWVPVKAPPAARRIAALAVAAEGKAIYAAGPGIGVARSEDGGRSWSARAAGLSANVTAIAPHADRPETVYAYASGRGIFRSEDGGQRWRLMDAGPRGGISRLVHSNMPGSMQTGWLFAAGPRGVQRAMDCFCGWRDAGEIRRDVRALAYDSRRPSRLYAATDRGLLRTEDGGQSWLPFDGPGGVSAVVVSPDGSLYAAAGQHLWHRADSARRWVSVDA